MAEAALLAQVVTVGQLEVGIDHVGWSADGRDGPHLILVRDSTNDGICLVTNGETYNGGVEAAAVGPGGCRLRLTQEAADALGLPTNTLIRYEPGLVNESDLRSALGRLLGSAVDIG